MRVNRNDFIAVALCLRLLGYKCTEGYEVELQPAILKDSDEYMLNLKCSTNLLPITYPRWEIGGAEYEATNLPPNFAVRQWINLEFRLEWSVIIRCFFKVFLNGSVVHIYSNAVTVNHTGNSLFFQSHAKSMCLYKLLYI